MNGIREFTDIAGAKIILKNCEKITVYDNVARDEAGLKCRSVHYNGDEVCEIFYRAVDEKAVEFLQGFILDHLNRKMLASEVLDNYREFNILYSVNDHMTACFDIFTAADRTIAESENLLEFDSAMILFKINDTLKIINTVKIPGQTEERDELFSICKTAMDLEKAEIINLPTRDARFSASKITCHKAFLLTPLKVKGRTIGSFALGCLGGRRYVAKDLKTLAVFSTAAAAAIENAGLYEEIRESLGQIVYSLIEAVERIDSENEGHSIRVAGLCTDIGRALNLTHAQLATLKFSALLHDVGKIGLGRDDYKSHPVNGCLILKHIKKFAEILPAIKHHHENYDGTGFPDNLAGGEIPLYARIIGVADYFDTLIRKKHFGVREATERIKSKVNVLFDESIVRAFLASVNAKH